MHFFSPFSPLLLLWASNGPPLNQFDLSTSPAKVISAKKGEMGKLVSLHFFARGDRRQVKECSSCSCCYCCWDEFEVSEVMLKCATATAHRLFTISDKKGCKRFFSTLATPLVNERIPFLFSLFVPYFSGLDFAAGSRNPRPVQKVEEEDEEGGGEDPPCDLPPFSLFHLLRFFF